MTKLLQELFNLPPAEESVARITVETANTTIEENRDMIAAVDDAISKIDAALPFVRDLDKSDEELDELSNLAKEKFNDLIDLGMNVEARFSGHILATAGTLLGHAITAKQAKIDKKLKMVDLQLKKANLDRMIRKDEEKTDGEKLLGAEDGSTGIMMDRNELLRQILGKNNHVFDK